MSEKQNKIPEWINWVILLFFCSAILGFFMPDFDVWNFLNKNSGGVQAVTTVILVIITALYALFTYETVAEMRKSRKDMFLPIISCSISPHKSNELILGVKNIGKGSALKIRISLLDKEEISFRQIDPSEYKTEPISINDEYIKKIEQSNDPVAKVFYQDLFGRKMETTAPIHVFNKGESLDTQEWRVNLPEK